MVDKAATIVRAKQLRRATLRDLSTAITTGKTNMMTLTRTTGLNIEADRQMATEQRMTNWARRMKSQAEVAAERLDHMTPTEGMQQLTEMSQGSMQRSILSQMLKRKAWTRSLQLAKHPTNQHPTNPLKNASRSRSPVPNQCLEANRHAATGQNLGTNRHAATDRSLGINRRAVTGQSLGTDPDVTEAQAHVTNREAPRVRTAQGVATGHNTATRLQNRREAATK